MDNAIVPAPKRSIIASMDDAERAAAAMAKSGYFQDSREMAQALVKVLAGQEMGFGPFASMTGISIIKGRPSIGANLMAAAVKGSGRYNYRVIEMTEKVCSIKFFEGREEIGTSTFTTDDARKAGTQNMERFPRNMLFARAMSNGVKWFCPDVFNGSPIYTPEELGATVNEDGEVIDVIPTPAPIEPPVVERQPAKPAQAAQPPEPEPAKPAAQGWDIEAIAKLSKDYDQNTQRIRNLLGYCKLAQPSNYDDLKQWVTLYRAARDEGKTPAEAGDYANAEFALSN